MKKTLSLILTIVMAVSLFSGCSDQSENNNAAQTSNDSSVVQTIDTMYASEYDSSWMDVQSAEESGTKLKVAFSTMCVTNDNYMTKISDTLKEYVEGLGHEYILSAASTSWGAPVSMQVNAIQDLIVADIDVLIFHAFDANALVPAIQKCHDAGIVVINVDSKLADGTEDLYTTFIGTKNYDVGYDGAVGLLEEFPDIQKYITLGGAEGNPSTIDRTEGFAAGMTELAADSVQVGDYFTGADSDKCMEYTESALVSDPDLEAVYVIADNCVQGIIQALKAAGKNPGDVKIVVAGGYDFTVPLMDEGWVTGAILFQPIEIALTAAQIGISEAQGLLQKDKIAENTMVTCPYVGMFNLAEYRDNFI